MNIKGCIDWGIAQYEWLMSFILRSHHVHVNREKYVRQLVRRFHRHASADEQQSLVRRALAGSPTDVLTDQQVNKAYRSLRWRYAVKVFVVSFFMTTVPNNLWIIILSCAVDLYFFQCMVFRSMQKIMMLYGQPLDLDADTDRGVETILEVDRSGIMVGKYPLLQKLKSGLGFVAKQAVQKLGPRFVSRFTRPAFIVIRRQCIKWFSVVVSKQHVSFLFDMLIPITCAVISGLVSVIVLVPMCNKLRRNIIANSRHTAH